MLVTVATYPRTLEAQLAQARLAAEGIEAIVADEQVASILPLHAGALGGVRLQVHEEDELAALELLELAAEDVGEVDDVEDQGPSCLRCASPYVEHGHTLQQKFAIAVTLGAALAMMPKRWHCGRCSFAWDAPSPSAQALAPSTADSPYRLAGPRRTDRAPRVSFRFPQRRVGVGTFFGSVLGWVGWRLIPGQLAGIAFFVASVAVGWVVGRLVINYACSACRRAITKDATRCPGCRADVRGHIARIDDHFRAIAELEAADKQRVKKKRKKRAQSPVAQ